MLKSLVEKYFSGLTKNSILLAFASLFSDISTEMLYPVLPMYLTQLSQGQRKYCWVSSKALHRQHKISYRDFQGGYLISCNRENRSLWLDIFFQLFPNHLLVWQIHGKWFWLQDFQIGWGQGAAPHRGMHCLQNR